jgi:hypothetical protein
VEQVSAKDWMRLVRDYNVRSRFLSRDTGRLARFINKLPYFRLKRS